MARKILADLPKMRAVMKKMRENPSMPHQVALPDGQVIDMLDGETEKLFSELEFFALAGLGQKINRGSA